MTAAAVRLKNVATVRVSNVDKKLGEGEVPVRLCNYTDVYYADTITADRGFMPATATPEQLETFKLRRGQILITKDSEAADDIGVPAFVDVEADDLVCGYHLAQITPNDRVIDPRFLYWAIASQRSREQFSLGASGVTRFGLRADTITGLSLSVPERTDQRRIADFLDAETARIDSLIDAKQQLIELAAIRLRSLVDQVVNSISARRTPLRRFTRSITQGVSSPAGTTPAAGEEWGVLKLSAVKWGRFMPTENKVLPDRQVDESLRPQVGDLLVTRSNTPTYVGDVCAVVRQPGWVLLPDLIYRLRLDDRLDPQFASYALRTSLARHTLTSAARGTSQSMVKLRGEDVTAVEIPVPALPIQREVRDRLDEATRTTEDLTDTLSHQIELLCERRQALIAVAVSGEMEVA